MKLRKSLASLCFMLFAFLFSMAASAAGNLEVCFLDVGQGLSVLLSCDGHYALYDGGIGITRPGWWPISRNKV